MGCFFFVFIYFNGMFDFYVDYLLLCSSLTSNSRRHTEAEAQPVIIDAGMSILVALVVCSFEDWVHSFITAT